MIVLYVIFGIWVGCVISYFTWIKPMAKEIDNLKEAMHDCIKAGLNK